MKKTVTILDLAKASGVSKSTISRFIQGENVSEEKREKIEAAIDELGYIRNRFAHLLRSKQSNILGVLVPDLDNPFFVKIIKRLDELSQKEGKTLIIKTFHRNPELELDAIKFIQSFLVDAIFLCRSELDEETIKNLNFNGPVLSIDKKFKSVNSIVSHNYQSGYKLTDHMHSRTDDNIMFFARKNESTSVNERIDGYRDFCDKHAMPQHIYLYDLEEDVDYQKLLTYVNDNNIGAVICRNDNDAVKILSFLNQMSYKGAVKPIKVAGFDNISLSRRIVPALTTIDQKIESLCDTAFNILMNFERYKVPRTFVQEGELIVRDTSWLWKKD